MMRVFNVLMLICLGFTSSLAQTIIKGTVTEQDVTKPIQFASIGIVNKPIGTVANADGVFEVTLSQDITDRDTIRFSSIGYINHDFLVSDLRKLSDAGSLKINLKKLVTELNTVSINAKHAQVKMLGYPTNSKLFGLVFGGNGYGAEGGIKLTIKHANTNIESLSLMVIQNSFNHLGFRVNIYEMQNGQPGKNILTQNIFFNIENKQIGKITFDLTPYNIYLNTDALLALEWIEAKPTTIGKFDVAAVLLGSSYYRAASQAHWIKKGAGIGIGVKTNY
jgi:hypothetical protein